MSAMHLGIAAGVAAGGAAGVWAERTTQAGLNRSQAAHDAWQEKFDARFKGRLGDSIGANARLVRDAKQYAQDNPPPDDGHGVSLNRDRTDWNSHGPNRLLFWTLSGIGAGMIGPTAGEGASMSLVKSAQPLGAFVAAASAAYLGAAVLSTIVLED